MSYPQTQPSPTTIVRLAIVSLVVVAAVLVTSGPTGATTREEPATENRFVETTSRGETEAAYQPAETGAIVGDGDGIGVVDLGGTNEALVSQDVVETVLTDFTPRQPGDSAGDYIARDQDDAVVLADGSPDGYTGGAVADGGTPFAAIDGYMGGEGCSIQCITSGVAYARGVGAKLAVTTHTQATIGLVVWNDELGYHSGFLFSEADQISFSHVFDDLEPGQTYQAMATAFDGEHTSHAFGTFETRVRNVAIYAGWADILYHKYDTSYFDKLVWLEGDWAGEYFADELELVDGEVDWGLNWVYLNDTDRYLDLQIQLMEIEWPRGELCQAFAGVNGPGDYLEGPYCLVGSNARLDEGEGDLDARPPDATSWVEHTLQRTLRRPDGGGPDLGFEVPITIVVTYDPA